MCIEDAQLSIGSTCVSGLQSVCKMNQPCHPSSGLTMPKVRFDATKSKRSDYARGEHRTNERAHLDGIAEGRACPVCFATNEQVCLHRRIGECRA